jgi:hypothetical protein
LHARVPIVALTYFASSAQGVFSGALYVYTYTNVCINILGRARARAGEGEGGREREREREREERREGERDSDLVGHQIRRVHAVVHLNRLVGVSSAAVKHGVGQPVEDALFANDLLQKKSIIIIRYIIITTTIIILYILS